MSQAAIVVSQIFVGLAVRSDRESILTIGLLSNPRYIAAQCLGVGFVAAISYLPALQAVFHTAPLNPTDWAMVFAFGGLLLLADEVRKLWVRRSTEPRTREGRT
jgi:magnesium-transporting ATPase (P-type)